MLLVTITEVEARAILNLFPNTQPRHIGDQTYHDLGSIRGAKIFMVQSEMGSGGPSGATLTIEEGIRLLHPSAVIMVGIAFGISEGKQSIGDILVSQQLIPYELQRVGTNSNNEHEIDLRDDRPSASTRMLQRFKATAKYWQAPPEVNFGPLLSGAKLIDNQDFRDQLLSLAPEAIGGEMEGSGLYAAAQRKKVDWIVVKAICDWADGNKRQDKKQRQQRAAENAARFTVSVLQQGGFTRSEQEIAEMSQSNSAEQHLNNLKSRYQTWLSKNTATFHIPGPSSVPLPIDTAWGELYVLRQEVTTQQGIEEFLRACHEWEGIASRADREVYNAKDVAEIGDRVVITGGPGAGKSTLCRKIAHDLTDLEEIVLWIDLPSLANRIQSEINITTALIDIAMNGFDASFEAREALLADADCLIADGLDECGNLVVAVAEALQRWSTSHPSTRIVLASRPIGYEMVYFPEWKHYALMSLTQDQVQSSSQKLIQALASDTTTLEKKVPRFQEQLKDNQITSLAARNPLLLGFLIQLSLQGEILAQQRADLYEQVLNLWRVSLPQGRVWQISQLDVLLAWRSLELIGWLLLLSEKGQKSRSHDQLVQQMSQQLMQEMDIPLLRASTTASNCLQFWHERGVLDRIQIGNQAIYAFVHTAFNEYTAGRYLARLSPSEIQQWVRSKYHDTRWQEPILYAAGCGQAKVVAEILLEIDAKDGLTTSSLLFAAAALAESPTVPDTLTRSVIDRLIARLTSINPPLVYEVAERGVSLVKKLPDLFVPRLQSLFAHHQIWTRLAATDLALASGSESVEIEILEQLLKDVIKDPINSLKPMKEEKEGKLGSAKELREWILASNDGWEIQNDVIVHGAEAIVRMRPDTATKELLQALYLSSAISLNTKGKLSRMLRDLGCQEFVEQHQVISEKAIKNWLNTGISADQKMLETILRITHLPDPQPKKRRKLIALTTLIYALNVPEADVTHWDGLHRLDDVTAIEAVLRGFIQLYKINTRELALDTVWALERIQDGLQNENTSVSLFQLLPRIPMELHVLEEIHMTVPTQELFRALKHPSAIIAYGAGWLLAVGGRKAELEDLLQKMKQEMHSNEQMKDILGRIVPYIWGNDVPLWLNNLLKGNQA